MPSKSNRSGRSTTAWKPLPSQAVASIPTLGSDEWPALVPSHSKEVKTDGYASGSDSTSFDSEDASYSDGADSCRTGTPEERSRMPSEELAADDHSDDGTGAEMMAEEGSSLSFAALLPSPEPTSEQTDALRHLPVLADGTDGQQEAFDALPMTMPTPTASGPPGLRMPLRSTARAFVPSGPNAVIRAAVAPTPSLDFMAPPPGLRKPLRATAAAFVPRSPMAGPQDH